MTSNPHYNGLTDLFYYDATNQKTIVYPEALNIVWGCDARYWKQLKPTAPCYKRLLSGDPPKNEEVSPAELIQVNWLEVTGSVDLKRYKTYKVQFQVSLTPDAFGWGNSPVYFMAKRDGGSENDVVWRKYSLSSITAGKIIYIPENLIIDMKNSSRLYFGMYEVWSAKWKGGLKIHHVLVEVEKR